MEESRFVAAAGDPQIVNRIDKDSSYLLRLPHYQGKNADRFYSWEFVTVWVLHGNRAVKHTQTFYPLQRQFVISDSGIVVRQIQYNAFVFF